MSKILIYVVKISASKQIVNQNRPFFECTTTLTDGVSRWNTSSRTSATLKINVKQIKISEISVWLTKAHIFEKNREKIWTTLNISLKGRLVDFSEHFR